MKNPTWHEFLKLFPLIKKSIENYVTVDYCSDLSVDNICIFSISEPLDEELVQKLYQVIKNELILKGFTVEYHNNLIILDTSKVPKTEIDIFLSTDTIIDEYDMYCDDDLRWRNCFKPNLEYVSYLESINISKNEINTLLDTDRKKDPYYKKWYELTYPKNDLILSIQYIIY